MNITHDRIVSLFAELNTLLDGLPNADKRKIAIAKTDAEKLSVWIEHVVKDADAKTIDTREIVDLRTSIVERQYQDPKYPFGCISLCATFRGEKFYEVASLTDYDSTVAKHKIKMAMEAKFPNFVFKV